jgi:hypothetical protein
MMTLNLIPPDVKRDFASAERLRRWMGACTILTILLSLTAVGITGGWFLLQRHAQDVAAELTATQQRQQLSNDKDITGTTTTLNSTIKQLSAAVGTPRSWGRDISTILQGFPTDIVLSDITVQSNGQFRLVGIANSRQAFLQLDDVLKKNPRLTSVATTSTASKRTAVPFDYTGTVTPPTP